ncbi:MAG TPA: hypothetical protein ENG45_00300 [Candidatus Aenigmarchaeota archaeon]|nr:hypothetical protein [Candidatus Aenigmarchaeota archaeon]
MRIEKIGEWAFLLGVLLAVIFGLYPIGYAGLILVILGVIVGLLNISEKETTSFLIAAIALSLPGTITKFGEIQYGDVIVSILANIATFVAPAAVIVALKAIWELGIKK